MQTERTCPTPAVHPAPLPRARGASGAPRRRRTGGFGCCAVGAACVLVAVSRVQATDFNEVEPNDSKAAANLVADMATNDTIVGVSTGAGGAPGPDSADYYRVRTAARTPGIYRHRLRLTTSGSAGHTGSIRGLDQTNGTIGTTDVAVQSSTSATTPPRFNQWYGFGGQEEIFYRVAGQSFTTETYRATLTTDSVMPVDIGRFRPGGAAGDGNLRITTVGQGHQTDTEVLVYDSALAALSGYLNDDEPSPGTSLQSTLTRPFAPGVYYLALSNFNTANQLPSPADDRTRTGNVLDFAGALVNSSTTVNLNLAFAVIDATGTHAFPATKTAPYEVLWWRFTVIPTDCNTNGVRDDLDITNGTSRDCNTNEIPDECDAADGPDCNTNRTPDACDLDRPFVDAGGMLSPLDAMHPQRYTVVRPPLAPGDVVLQFTARADLDLPSEFVRVRLNGGVIGDVFVDGAHECPATPDAAMLTVPRAVWNAAAATGRAIIDMTPSAEVDACVPESFIAVSVAYAGDDDCNTNGVPDECDIADGSADCNSNGIPDVCEPLLPLVDCNNNGTADDIDIASGASSDADGDGIPDECSFWVGMAGSYDVPGNWRPPVVPNTPVGPARSVTIQGAGSNVLLNIDARIDTLRLLLCAQLNAVGGDLRIASERGVLNQGLIRISGAHALIAQSACPLRGEGVLRLDSADARLLSAPGALIRNELLHTLAGQGAITADLFNAGTIVADVPGQVLLLAGPGVKINDGVLKAANTGVLRITTNVHDNPEGGALFAKGGTIAIEAEDEDVTVDGCGPVDVEPGSPGVISLDRAHLINATRWRIGDDQTGPGMSSTVRLLRHSTGDVHGPIAVNRNGVLDIASGSVQATRLDMAAGATLLVDDQLALSGHVTLSGDDESRWLFGPDAVLMFTGGIPGCAASDWNTLEVGGLDAGPDGSYTLNFDLSTLRVAAHASLLLVDAVDNGNRNGPLGMAEALYADALVLDAGAVLHLGGVHLYVAGMQVTPGRFGEGLIVDGSLGVPGDVSHDGLVDGADIGPFLDVLYSGSMDCSADLNGDGMVNVDDAALLVLVLLGG